jgi:hypothetical protein
MKEFYTRARANEGAKMELVTPDGAKSEHYLIIAGIDSDTFRQAEAVQRRAVLALDPELSLEAREEAVEELRIELIASTVISWSFPIECTLKNVCDFLKEAPQIRSAINHFAANRKAFFA